MAVEVCGVRVKLELALPLLNLNPLSLKPPTTSHVKPEKEALPCAGGEIDFSLHTHE